jgi:hypothetical protein
MTPRSLVKERTSLGDRLKGWAKKTREQAESMKPGPEKDMLLKKVSQAEKASQVNAWVNSLELRSRNRTI